MLRCDNCDWTGDEPGRDLWDVPGLSERLDVGGIVPAGECPECGCLCYEQTPDRAVGDAAGELFKALMAVRHAFYVDGKAKALRAAFEATTPLVRRLQAAGVTAEVA